MVRSRIISKHALRRTAERKMKRLKREQEEAKGGYPKAVALLAKLGLTQDEKLSVRKENRRFWKWAVIAN